MKSVHLICWVLATLLSCSVVHGQPTSASAGAAVPRLVNFSGIARDAQGKPIAGTVGATFAIYKDESGGAPLWLETENVQADTKGKFTVQLGSTKPEGLPLDLFASGEARWLGVRIEGGEEQPRTLLLSVPYALKALDAETLGGKPASAFMTAVPGRGNGIAQSGAPIEQRNEIVCSSGTACKKGFVPLFSSNGGSAKVTDSIVTQSGSKITVAGSETVSSAASSPALVGQSSGTNAVSDGVDGITSSGSASGVAGINNGNGVGVYGIGGTGVYATSNSGYGVYASSNSSHGVYGISNSSCCFGVVGEGVSAGLYGSGGYGVLGFGTSGYGIYGQHAGASSLGSELPYAGIWGDTNSQVAAGVAGTGQDGVGGIFLNDSPQGYYSLIAASYASGAPMFTAENIANGVSCSINQNAHLQCDGGIGAMVQVDNGKRKLAMSGIESPENWFEDFGSAQLINGSAVIQLDPDFIQTVNTEKDYRVFPVPNGDCKGLYVANKSVNSFEVRELGGGSSNIRFDYRITAMRRNYETVRFEDHTKDLDPKNMLEQMRKAKPASSSSPASLKPASQPAVGIPRAQLSKQ